MSILYVLWMRWRLFFDDHIICFITELGFKAEVESSYYQGSYMKETCAFKAYWNLKAVSFSGH